MIPASASSSLKISNVNSHDLNAIQDMIFMCLDESFEIAKYSISNLKVDKSGCYGFPAAILLLSIVDSIGSYVVGKDKEVNVKNHFEILEDKNYFDPPLNSKARDNIYTFFRCKLVHNATLCFHDSCVLLAENTDNPQCLFEGNTLYLKPFLEACKNAIETFKQNSQSIITADNKKIKEVIKGKKR